MVNVHQILSHNVGSFGHFYLLLLNFDVHHLNFPCDYKTVFSFLDYRQEMGHGGSCSKRMNQRLEIWKC